MIEQFQNAWELTDYLFSALPNSQASSLQPEPLRQPLIFYYGHPAAFHAVKLRSAGYLHEPVDAELESLLQRGVDPAVSSELPTNQWPPLARVVRFREQVRERVLDVLSDVFVPQPIHYRHPPWALLMGIEHERLHFETTSVLIRQSPLAMLQVPLGWKDAPVTPIRRSTWIEIDEGFAKLGKPINHPSFGWDNEYGSLNSP